jgi:CheY-like chemotaxis protein
MAKPRILVVEDNATKQAEIESALGADFDILSTRSIAGAYRLMGHQWDLIILDMTFQVGQVAGRESSKESLAGIELLQFMTSRDITIPVIVATQHSSFSTAEMPHINSVGTLEELLRDAFPRIFRAIIEVDLSEEAWKPQLSRAVRSALERQGV